MMGWTDDQLKAIETDTNLLVSAAAGSGKTAVLVERIIRKLIGQGKSFVPADRLLVVTFARDAAREMSDRIKKSLTSALASEKNAKRKRVLAAQLKLLPFADITTIDAFCMRLVKQHFHLLGIDPKFSIMDSSDAKVFTLDCINEFFDSLYEKGDKDFLRLVSLYCSGYDDRELVGILYDVFTFTRSLPNPDEWISTHAEDYKKFSGSAACKHLEERFASESEMCSYWLSDILKDYIKEVGSDDEETLKEYGYLDFFTVIKSDLAAIETAPDWNSMLEIRDSFPPLKKKRPASDEEETQRSYISRREWAVDGVRKILSEVRASTKELDKEYKEKLYPHARSLSRLLRKFSVFFFDKKNKANKFEFNDLEHLTIKLLREHEDIRAELTEKYVEILMDEYQDTNGLQEEIFSMISNGKNRFAVGDIKQSIYRFRQSDPLIFRNLDYAYKQNPKLGNRVVLSQNFRSRESVLESVNYVFKRIMTYDVIGVDYDKEQALFYGNKEFDRKSEKNDYTAELHVLESKSASSDDESLSDIELEADFAAEKIRGMIDGGFEVLDGKVFRPAVAEDFVILANSVKSVGEFYVDALIKRGISAYTEDSGFFLRTEIIMIMEFIKTINNPLRDIPLVSVMRSPVYRFTDEELARIRLAAHGELWRAVRTYGRGDSELSEKCRAFSEDINRWRTMSRHMSADRLIWRILTESSLYDISGILYGGIAAPANLRLFMERARILSEGGIATLFDFEQHISRISEVGGPSCAKISGSGVQIMTIHKSKGLEFPIVFICGMGRKFMSDDAGAKVGLHNKLGFGLLNINESASYSIPTVNKNVIKSVKNEESAFEQIRKLYVAMTRAKEKLVVTSVVPSAVDKKTNEKQTFAFADLSEYLIRVNDSKRYIEMLAPLAKNCTNKSWSYYEISNDTPVAESSPPPKTERIDIESVRKEVNRLLDRFGAVELPIAAMSKISVSELKSKTGYSAKLQRLPAFMESDELRGASFGTAVHGIMEKITLLPSMTQEHIKAEVKRICGAESETICTMVSHFFESSLGVRACSCGAVRESAFEIEIPAIDRSGAAVDGENTLLQGVVDMYFEDENGLVLVDYKTDRCKKLSELAEKYAIQLKWYKYAMEKLLKKKVCEVYIYSFHKGEAIEIGDEVNDEQYS